MYYLSDTESAIEELQTYLKKIQKTYSINPSGVYDEKTKSAVKDFQSSNGINSTGITDFITFSSIYSQYSNIVEQENIINEYEYFDFPINIGETTAHMPHIVSLLEDLADYYRIDYAYLIPSAYTREASLIVGRLKEIYQLDLSDLSITAQMYSRMVNDALSIKKIKEGI